MPSVKCSSKTVHRFDDLEKVTDVIEVDCHEIRKYPAFFVALERAIDEKWVVVDNLGEFGSPA
jgi:hypothetical protein